MKVAVTGQGPDLNSPVDPLFGRAKYFAVVDTDSGEFSLHDNASNVRAAHGAGTRAARIVVDLAVDAVITGNVGHKAFGILQANNIGVFAKDSGTVQEAIEELTNGRLEVISTANVPGHWKKVS